MNEIEIIKKLLKKLGEKGYSENIEIKITIDKFRTNYIIDREKKFNNFKDLNKYLDKLLQKVIEIQTEYYENNELIRFIYGRQFNLFNSWLKEKDNKNIILFLKYLTNDIINSD